MRILSDLRASRAPLREFFLPPLFHVRAVALPFPSSPFLFLFLFFLPGKPGPFPDPEIFELLGSSVRWDPGFRWALQKYPLVNSELPCSEQRGAHPRSALADLVSDILPMTLPLFFLI